MSTTSYSVVSCSLVRVPNPYFSSACTSTSWVCGFTCTFPEYAELGQYDAGREPLYLQVLGQRFAEEDEEVLLHGVFHAVPFVVLVQLFYLLALVPVSETVFQQGERLGVDAGMVHRGVVVYAGDGDGEETPVSTDVLQALPVVGARDEGAVAGQGEGFDVVGLALRHVVLRDDSLQCCQLAGLHAFEPPC